MLNKSNVIGENTNEPLPNFSLPATGNAVFTLYPILSKSLVIYFYPKDNTPGCTTEAQQFRDLYAEFKLAGSEVLGVSRDSIKSHESFKAKFELPFALLADTDEAVCQLFSVMKQKNMYGKQVRGIERSTFILNNQGVICKQWRGLKADGHARDVLSFVQTLQG